MQNTELTDDILCSLWSKHSSQCDSAQNQAERVLVYIDDAIISNQILKSCYKFDSKILIISNYKAFRIWAVITFQSN